MPLVLCSIYSFATGGCSSHSGVCPLVCKEAPWAPWAPWHRHGTTAQDLAKGARDNAIKAGCFVEPLLRLGGALKFGVLTGGNRVQDEAGRGEGKQPGP